jgi:hypothetical protein
MEAIMSYKKDTYLSADCYEKNSIVPKCGYRFFMSCQSTHSNIPDSLKKVLLKLNINPTKSSHNMDEWVLVDQEKSLAKNQ